MGGSLGGVFSNTGAGANGAPSLLQKLVQGTAKGAGTALGKGMQTPPPGGPGGGSPGAPAATPVDPRFFQPSTFASRTPLPNGGAPGLVQPINPASAFYG